TGITGSFMTRSIIFSMGIARLEAELREKTRCVISSACTNRGYVIWNVVRRAPDGLMESARIFASYAIINQLSVSIKLIETENPPPDESRGGSPFPHQPQPVEFPQFGHE